MSDLPKPRARARRLALLLLVGATLAAPMARAAEPSGCNGFKWPIDHERAALTGPVTKTASGATIAVSTSAYKLALTPQADTRLPVPPERLPKAPDTVANRFAGYVRVADIPAAGTYTVALSAAAWLDAIQDDKPLKPAAFSGATDCDGIRKVVKFDLARGPLLLQVSSVTAGEIVLAVLPPQ